MSKPPKKYKFPCLQPKFDLFTQLDGKTIMESPYYFKHANEVAELNIQERTWLLWNEVVLNQL